MEGVNKVEDQHINTYLDARNLISNRKNSINSEKINRLDHYIWWFNEKKNIFYFCRKKKIRLYLFHKKIKIDNKIYYYGGWFTSRSKVLLKDIISVIKWQILKYKKFKWLAIIKKEIYL